MSQEWSYLRREQLFSQSHHCFRFTMLQFIVPSVPDFISGGPIASLLLTLLAFMPTRSADLSRVSTQVTVKQTREIH